jgi:hypothetical protein
MYEERKEARRLAEEQEKTLDSIGLGESSLEQLITIGGSSK